MCDLHLSSELLTCSERLDFLDHLGSLSVADHHAAGVAVVVVVSDESDDAVLAGLRRLVGLRLEGQEA